MDVTEYAKQIFGEGIVISAIIDPEYLNGRVIDLSENHIHPLDGCPLHVLLSNGHKVQIWTSEWGGIDKI